MSLTETSSSKSTASTTTSTTTTTSPTLAGMNKTFVLREGSNHVYNSYEKTLNILSLEYVVLANGPGCGDNSINETDCAVAAGKLGYSTNVRIKDVPHAPYACMVQSNNGVTWWNKRHGQTGRHVYKSICKNALNGIQ